MCSHYQTLKDAELLLKKFGAPNKPAGGKYDMWPRYPGVFIRRPVEHDAGDEAVPEREAVVGRWGLISAMTKADGLDKAGKLSTFNARSETAAKSFTFSSAWRRAQHCIIPADAIFEPDWRSGAAVATRFTRADGAPLGVAGLWDRYRDAAGESPLGRLGYARPCHRIATRRATRSILCVRLSLRSRCLRRRVHTRSWPTRHVAGRDAGRP